MDREHLRNPDVNRSHEPAGIPLNRPPGTFSPTGGEGRDAGVRFMGSEHLQKLDVSWGHEPLLVSPTPAAGRLTLPTTQEWGEGKGEGIPIIRFDGTCPSPQPSPRSCLAGRGSGRLPRWW